MEILKGYYGHLRCSYINFLYVFAIMILSYCIKVDFSASNSCDTILILKSKEVIMLSK